MNLHVQKLNLMKMILETENPRILESITNIFAAEEKIDFWHLLTDEQKHDIEIGLQEIADSEVVEYNSIVGPHRR